MSETKLRKLQRDPLEPDFGQGRNYLARHY